jgi:hypothetical protein
VVGYELSWQQHRRASSTADELEALIGFVAEQVNDDADGWLLRDKLLFLEAVPAMLSTDALHQLPPERTVLSIKAAELADRHHRPPCRRCAPAASASCCATPT